MLKRYDIYHSIADDVLIPKMYFFIKIVPWLFSKIVHLCSTRYLFFSGLAELSVDSQAGFFKSH